MKAAVDLVAFVLAGILFGRGILGKRTFDEEEAGGLFRDQNIINGFLWFVCLALCAAIEPLTHSWPIMISAIAGTFAGAIFWRPVVRIQINPRLIDETEGQEIGCPDEDAAAFGDGDYVRADARDFG